MIGALLSSVAFGGVQTVSLAWEKERRVAAEVRNASLTLLLDGCRARADNLIEDKESDDAIDKLTDDELRVAPADWMLPSGASNRDPAAD
jgi:hypothetical protein